MKTQSLVACLQECKISKSFGQNETQVLYTFDDKSQPLDYQSLASNLQTQLGSMMTGYSSQQQVPAAATPTVSITIPTVSSIPAAPTTPATPGDSSAAATAVSGGTATGKLYITIDRNTYIGHRNTTCRRCTHCTIGWGAQSLGSDLS